MKKVLYVINPNSTQAVTDAFDSALDVLRLPDGPSIECLTLAEGPPGVQTQMDVESVVLPLTRQVRELDAGGGHAGAFVIACFSDPGLHAVREVTSKPVLGIGESGMLAAMSLGHKIGVIAILRQSIARHTRSFAAMGISARVAGELPLDLNVVELGEPAPVKARLREVACRLRDEYQSDVLVLGCAGMAAYRAWLQDEIGLPVVDPTQAACAHALGRALLDNA